jgi:hypothetical protein
MRGTGAVLGVCRADIARGGSHRPGGEAFRASGVFQTAFLLSV